MIAPLDVNDGADILAETVLLDNMVGCADSVRASIKVTANPNNTYNFLFTNFTSKKKD
jgi:hypothetical protein